MKDAALTDVKHSAADTNQLVPALQELWQTRSEWIHDAERIREFINRAP
jgi:hypothetical protein